MNIEATSGENANEFFQIVPTITANGHCSLFLPSPDQAPLRLVSRYFFRQHIQILQNLNKSPVCICPPLRTGFAPMISVSLADFFEQHGLL